MNASPDAAGERERRFAACYLAIYPDLLRFVARRVHPSHAEDVVASTFLVAWRRFEDLPDDLDAARAWVFGIARRSLLNDARSARRQLALAVRIADAQPADVADGPLDPDLLATRLDLARGWARLSAAEQEVIALTAWDGLDSAGAAGVLGITPVAYRLRLSRARRALRRHVDSAVPVRTLHPSSVVEGPQR